MTRQAAALIGPRRVGKTTLALSVVNSGLTRYPISTETEAIGLKDMAAVLAAL